MVGGLIMGHGDDAGLRLPPALAPTQVVVLLVRDEAGAGEVAARLVDELLARGVRAELDARVDQSFGRRAVDWELKGVPVRIEVGPRDLADGIVTLVRRDRGEKEPAHVHAVASQVPDLLDIIQLGLLFEATRRREARTAEVSTLADAAEAATEGFARVPWALVGPEGEAVLARDAVSVRCLQRPDGTVPDDEDEPDLLAVVARSY
jgi:prolyl-tRNA synthetase